MADLGRPHENLYEVALWEDMLAIQDSEVFYAYLVDNQAIVVPETIDAIRALTELERDPRASIEKTSSSLGIANHLLRPRNRSGTAESDHRASILAASRIFRRSGHLRMPTSHADPLSRTKPA
jgi:hypothetical protein